MELGCSFLGISKLGSGLGAGLVEFQSVGLTTCGLEAFQQTCLLVQLLMLEIQCLHTAMPRPGRSLRAIFHFILHFFPVDSLLSQGISNCLGPQVLNPFSIFQTIWTMYIPPMVTYFWYCTKALSTP